MDYAASSADIEVPALAAMRSRPDIEASDPEIDESTTSESPIVGHTRRDFSRQHSSLVRVAVSAATICGCCTAIFCILAPLAWLPFAFIIWAEHSREPCDQPLPTWLESYLLYSLLMPYFKAGILRLACGWQPEAENDPPPRRVRRFSHALDGLPVAWMVFARVLISRSHTCQHTCKTLYTFVDWFSAFMLVFTFLRFVGGALCIIIFQLWFSGNGDLPDWMLSILQKQNAASPDTINKIETVAYDAGLFADPEDPQDDRPAGECSICLQAYDGDLEIKRTECGHLCHTACLEEWLRRARTCPTCRKDLEEVSEAVPRGETELDMV